MEPTELIEQLTQSGPDSIAPIMPHAAATALIYRDVLGTSRKETAEILDISPWTLDESLRRARDKTIAATALVRVLHDLDAIHEDAPLDELRSALCESDSSGSSQDQSQQQDTTQPPYDLTDRSASAWAALMRIPNVAKVERQRNGDLQVALRDSNPNLTDRVSQLVEEIGYQLTTSIEDWGDLDILVFGPIEQTADEPESAAPQPRQIDDDLTAAIAPRDESASVPRPIETDDRSVPQPREIDQELISAIERHPGADPVETLDGIGTAKAAALRDLGIETITDIHESSGGQLLVSGVIGDLMVARIKQEAAQRLGEWNESE